MATGKTTTQMKIQSTFIDWNFVNIWKIAADMNDGYPYLFGTTPTDLSSSSSSTNSKSSSTSFIFQSSKSSSTSSKSNISSASSKSNISSASSKSTLSSLSSLSSASSLSSPSTLSSLSSLSSASSLSSPSTLSSLSSLSSASSLSSSDSSISSGTSASSLSTDSSISSGTSASSPSSSTLSSSRSSPSSRSSWSSKSQSSQSSLSSSDSSISSGTSASSASSDSSLSTDSSISSGTSASSASSLSTDSSISSGTSASSDSSTSSGTSASSPTSESSFNGLILDLHFDGADESRDPLVDSSGRGNDFDMPESGPWLDTAYKESGTASYLCYSGTGLVGNASRIGNADFNLQTKDSFSIRLWTRTYGGDWVIRYIGTLPGSCMIWAFTFSTTGVQWNSYSASNVQKQYVNFNFEKTLPWEPSTSWGWEVVFQHTQDGEKVYINGQDFTYTLVPETRIWEENGRIIDPENYKVYIGGDYTNYHTQWIDNLRITTGSVEEPSGRLESQGFYCQTDVMYLSEEACLAGSSGFSFKSKIFLHDTSGIIQTCRDIGGGTWMKTTLSGPYDTLGDIPDCEPGP